MKKTLAAVAVLGAFAGSAVAADVTLYGLVDYSLQYQHLDADVATADATDTTQMASGANSGSRFGLKGTEDLGNGVKVGFVLENGFAADTGALGNSSRLFDRESQLFVEGAFGRVAFGRFGQLASSLGSYGLLGVTGPFSTGWSDATAGLKYVNANGHSRYDNAITYVTPSFGGLTVYAQYSSASATPARKMNLTPTVPTALVPSLLAPASPSLVLWTAPITSLSARALCPRTWTMP